MSAPKEPASGDALEESLLDLYENAPCGYLSLWPDGTIAKLNSTIAGWLGRQQDSMIGTSFTRLLTAGGRIHYETHFAPILHMNGHIDGVTVDLVTADGGRLPVFLTANVKTDDCGEPVLIRITALDARHRRAYERELLEARKRADDSRARVELLAKTLQRSLLPSSLSPPVGLDAQASYHYASTEDVGGDFYDLFPLATDQWGFFLGDVCGKGAGAAAVTSLTRYTLRAAAVYDRDPIAVLHNLDTVFEQEFHATEPQFCTVIFGVLTVVDDGFDVELAGGGHPPALLLRADGSASFVETTGGQLVGILPNARFVSTRLSLRPGDTLVLYTDGLTEARVGPGRERYDDTGALLDFARSHSPTTAEAIIDDIRALLDSFGAGLEDDAAVLALGVPAGPDTQLGESIAASAVGRSS
ncbi:histidine kinase [Rhodococcus sp. PAMC28707]|uniref:SpoIIE family protein phosphatase n=1 Tax=unclassified Rhodococcus (in: high G+C Gram-positive bacteria) TaxID=192944 RepID=UPI00109E249E|nr:MULTISPECIES: SpoIIE family protein phosphatase [unclassified Rhodococcus (in: high G+C Gram-positive bacteria)]QCB50405.1 histidine kinase [Rhodococcus sp. PAMC28705]QCB57903.1 histidine kinase [Rhodococcus sp. PAMC28707]